MDLKQLARSLGVTQQPAISRATELLRLLKLKVPGSLGQGEICRPAVCLELACQITPGSKLPLREEFIRYSCSAPKVYNETFTRVQRLLDVTPSLDLRELVTLFGCSQLHDSTQHLLSTYKNRLLGSLTDAERSRADLNRSAFVAAAFLLTAKKHRAHVDRAALIARMGVRRAELSAALDDIMARCEDQLVAASIRKQGNKAPTGDVDEPPTPGTSVAGSRDQRGVIRSSAKRRRRTEDNEDDGQEDGAAPVIALDDFKLALVGAGQSTTPSVVEGLVDADQCSRGVGPRRKAFSRAVDGPPGGSEKHTRGMVDTVLTDAADQD